MEEQNKKGELVIAIQTLKQSAGWIYLSNIISNWKDQALTEVLEKKESDKEKGEFAAFSRVLKLPDIIIKDLNEEKPKDINLDAYLKPNEQDTGSDTPAR